MKYRDLFKQTFDAVHASEDTVTEVMKMAKSNIPYKTNRSRSLYRTILIAAAMAALLVTAAFAANLLDVQTLLTGDKIIDPSGEEQYALSLSQPQAVSEELDPSIAGKVATGKDAWAEWSEWLESNRFVTDLDKKLEQLAPNGTASTFITETSPDMPGLAESEGALHDASALVLEKYGSGVTVAIFFDDKGEHLGDVAISAEEMELHIRQLDEHLQDPARLDDRYESYRVSTKEEADKLEEIAAKYGLALRGKSEAAWPDVTASSAYDDLTEIMLQAGCRGNIFTELPTLFDKIVWYDEGTFLISFDAIPPSGNTVMCKGYNAMYATLSSGNELQDTVADPESLTARSYTAADGTELTILENNREAYLYVYLEDSFFTEAIHVADNAPNLSREDINYIADFLSYSLIGG